MTHSLLDIPQPRLRRKPRRSKAQLWPTCVRTASVFRWAVWEMAKVAKQALETAGITPDELGALIPHQANARIIDQMVKTLKLPDTVAVARDIVDAGNTSAASVPSPRPPAQGEPGTLRQVRPADRFRCRTGIRGSRWSLP